MVVRWMVVVWVGYGVGMVGWLGLGEDGGEVEWCAGEGWDGWWGGWVGGRVG